MGKTKFGTKIVFFCDTARCRGSVICEKLHGTARKAYAVSLMDGAGQAQSQLAAMIASDVKKMAPLWRRAYHNGRCGCGRHH